MPGSATLITIGVVAGAVVFVILGFFAAIRQFYRVPEADEALVKTGGRKPVVSTGGGLWVVPMFHKVSRVSLQAIRIPIDRGALNALPTADKIMAEVKGELFVQVNPQAESDIIQAVQSLGICDPGEMAKRVREKIDSLVTDALRTAAFKKTFLELNSQKKEFADEVIGLLQEDLGKLGLTLTAVSIPNIYQGPFTDDAGDVFAAEGRRNVAQTVEKNREETNRIKREAEIKVQQQDVTAREQALELDLRQRQREADQLRQISEYEAQQTAETRKAVLEQDKRTKQAEAGQEREVEIARISEREQAEGARIATEQKLGVQRADAIAAQKVAEADAARKQEEAHIARQKAIEAAIIVKEQEIKVADEQRQRAIAEAEIAKQVAIAQKREEEALARGKQAEAEAKQREAEEGIVTVRARAEAERQKGVVTIRAEEDAAKDKIAADRDAYVETRKAEAERDAAIKRAEAVQAEATGRASARKAEAEGYAAEIRIRAEADYEAADKQATARGKLAEAELQEGQARAEARRRMVEAENAVSSERLVRDVTIRAIEVAPDVVRELMLPVSKVAHDVKILQVQGMGGEGVGGLPQTLLQTGLAAAGIAPFLKEAFRAVTETPEAKEIGARVTEVAKSALKTAAEAATEVGPQPNGNVDEVAG